MVCVLCMVCRVCGPWSVWSVACGLWSAVVGGLGPGACFPLWRLPSADGANCKSNYCAGLVLGILCGCRILRGCLLGACVCPCLCLLGITVLRAHRRCSDCHRDALCLGCCSSCNLTCIGESYNVFACKLASLFLIFPATTAFYDLCGERPAQQHHHPGATGS